MSERTKTIQALESVKVVALRYKDIDELLSKIPGAVREVMDHSVGNKGYSDLRDPLKYKLHIVPRIEGFIRELHRQSGQRKDSK